MINIFGPHWALPSIKKTEAYKRLQDLDKIFVLKVKIFPDFKDKGWGLPTGTLIETHDRLFPTAVPDVGCSFRLVRFSGVDPQAFASHKIFKRELKSLFYGGASVFEVFPSLENLACFKLGHRYTEQFFNSSTGGLPAIDRYEGGGFQETCLTRSMESKLKNLGNKRFNEGLYPNHFCEFNVLNNGKGDVEGDAVYALIHTGSGSVAKSFMEHFFIEIAKDLWTKGQVAEHHLTHGLFSLTPQNKHFNNFLEGAKAICNFSFAYRDLIQIAVSNLFKKYFPQSQGMLMSDHMHTHIQTNGSSHIRHLRGVQRIVPVTNRSHAYCIAGGPKIPSFLFQPLGEWEGSHGIPLKPLTQDKKNGQTHGKRVLNQALELFDFHEKNIPIRRLGFFKALYRFNRDDYLTT